MTIYCLHIKYHPCLWFKGTVRVISSDTVFMSVLFFWMSDYNWWTPGPICLKFWLWITGMLLTCYTNSKLSGLSFLWKTLGNAWLHIWIYCALTQQCFQGGGKRSLTPPHRIFMQRVNFVGLVSDELVPIIFPQKPGCNTEYAAALS